MSNVEDEIDDIIDNFNLKPITKGLGFHHSLKEVQEIKVDLKKNSKSLKKDFENRVSQLNKTNKKSSMEVSADMGELSAFYNKEEVKEEKINISLDVTSQAHKEAFGDATMVIRFLAWITDVFVLFALMVSMFSAIVYFADLPLETLSSSVLSGDLLVSFSLMALMVYIFYFSFFDKTSFSTPGKNIFDIRVTSTSEKKVSLMKVFFRTCTCVVSVLFLGLPVLLKLHDTLSETRVTKKS